MRLKLFPRHTITILQQLDFFLRWIFLFDGFLIVLHDDIIWNISFVQALTNFVDLWFLYKYIDRRSIGSPNWKIYEIKRNERKTQWVRQMSHRIWWNVVGNESFALFNFSKTIKLCSMPIWYKCKVCTTSYSKSITWTYYMHTYLNSAHTLTHKQTLKHHFLTNRNDPVSVWQ